MLELLYISYEHDKNSEALAWGLQCFVYIYKHKKRLKHSFSAFIRAEMLFSLLNKFIFNIFTIIKSYKRKTMS